ncbi:hypothetical protein MM213_15110 [Belliella sp. R4-6]|uniref:Uncharacterized protein n=1 Tax=Belliella alkalica TaxID=1730871 RepID=A0ABS9VEF6_9BACT|nr:hypothetical protein [Belliella alkalica]MCH7414828.1 hypothetical protein [Belliella alkalica]
MHSEREFLSKAQDYFDLNSTFGKSESASARTINYGDYFPVWRKAKRVRKERDFLIVPFHRRINREYEDQNYIRRLVFEYDTEGELTRAGVIELISGTLSLRQLAERHETIIEQYLKGNPSEGVRIVWSDVNMNELEGIDLTGRGVTIQEQSEGIGSRILDDGCVYYFYILRDKATNNIISATYLYKQCPPTYGDNDPCAGIEEVTQEIWVIIFLAQILMMVLKDQNQLLPIVHYYK